MRVKLKSNACVGASLSRRRKFLAKFRELGDIINRKKCCVDWSICSHGFKVRVFLCYHIGKHNRAAM